MQSESVAEVMQVPEPSDPPGPMQDAVLKREIILLLENFTNIKSPPSMSPAGKANNPRHLFNQQDSFWKINMGQNIVN